MNKSKLGLNFVVIGIIFSVSLEAATRIAILNFELNDITSLPDIPTEIIRTASMKPLLEKAIKNLGDYEIIEINANEVAYENAGVGYLYKFHDIAASLGKKCGADWVIVGQHSKPSFLFSYIKANLIDVKTKNIEAHYDIELKGNHRKVTEQGIKSLAQRITKKIIH